MWQWLSKGDLKVGTEVLLSAAQGKLCEVTHQ